MGRVNHITEYVLNTSLLFDGIDGIIDGVYEVHLIAHYCGKTCCSIVQK